MMEGYFVRTLGMHRVYNSAFMNMLKKEENQKYRETVKNTIIFDPQILKRYVNFMNNPDEETANDKLKDAMTSDNRRIIVQAYLKVIEMPFEQIERIYDDMYDYTPDSEDEEEELW